MPEKERIVGFDTLRTLAIVAVVAIHSSDVALKKSGYFPVMTLEGAGWYLLNALLRFCVPVFFIMSAFLSERRYLQSGKAPETNWRRFAVLLLVASAVYLLVTLVQSRLLHRPLAGKNLFLSLITGQVYYHTWFLASLLLYVLLHGFLRRLSAGRCVWLWFAGGMLFYAVPLWHTPPQGGPLSMAVYTLLSGIPYYVLGLQAASHEASLRSLKPEVIGLLFAGGLLLLGSYALLWRDRTFYTPGVALFAAALFLLALRTQRSPLSFAGQIGTFSLGIYLWHPLFLDALRVAEGRLYRERVSAVVTLGVMLLEVAAPLTGSFLLSLALARNEKLRVLAQ